MSYLFDHSDSIFSLKWSYLCLVRPSCLVFSSKVVVSMPYSTILACFFFKSGRIYALFDHLALFFLQKWSYLCLIRPSCLVFTSKSGRIYALFDHLALFFLQKWSYLCLIRASWLVFTSKVVVSTLYSTISPCLFLKCGHAIRLYDQFNLFFLPKSGHQPITAADTLLHTTLTLPLKLQLNVGFLL